jgi:hypothetical protein
MSLITLRASLSGRHTRHRPAGRTVAPNGTLRSAARRLRRLLPVAPSLIAAAILVAYHLVLLWHRLADMSLLQPAVALRWVATVALLIGLRRMHAAGVPLIWGRRALAFWLFVLLLHVSFLGPLSEEAAATGESRASAGLALILPAAAPLTLFFTFFLTCWLAARASKTPSAPPLNPLTSHSGREKHPRREGWLPSLASRPPPAVG